jgi:hypothetical protein
MLDELPGNRRHAAGQGHAFAFDRLQGFFRIELAQQDQLAAVEHGRDHGSATTRRMKQGHCEQGHSLRQCGGVWRYLTASKNRARHRGSGSEHVGGDVSMRNQRALGLARGARGVEDRRVVFGIERHLRQRQIGQLAPIGDAAEHGFQLGHARIGDLLAPAAHINALQIGAFVHALGDAFVTLGIDDGDPRPRVREPVLHLRTDPPRVERGGDGADQCGGEERNRPFGKIAHDEGDTIAFRHALLL